MDPRKAIVAALVACLPVAGGCSRKVLAPAPVHAGRLTLSLETQPDPPRSRQEVLFHLRLQEGGRPVNDARVTLDLSMPGMNHGENLVPLSRVGDGVYEGIGVLVMPGRWQAGVRVDRPARTVRATIPFDAPR